MTENLNQKPTSPSRVLSIDALRGFDMFWIMGGDAFAKGLFDRHLGARWRRERLGTGHRGVGRKMAVSMVPLQTTNLSWALIRYD